MALARFATTGVEEMSRHRRDAAGKSTVAYGQPASVINVTFTFCACWRCMVWRGVAAWCASVSCRAVSCRALTRVMSSCVKLCRDTPCHTAPCCSMCTCVHGAHALVHKDRASVRPPLQQQSENHGTQVGLPAGLMWMPQMGSAMLGPMLGKS